MSWTVRAVMTNDVVSVRPQTSYKEVARLMAARGISAVPVVEAEGAIKKVVGIVSEADLLLKEEHGGAALRHSMVRPDSDESRAGARTAGAMMTWPVVTVAPDASLSEAARLMHRNGVKRLPVVDLDGGLVGIVSRFDLIKAFLRSDSAIRREVEEDVVGRVLRLDGEAIVVSVADGVVTLEGMVDDDDIARILARLVQSVEGVVGVNDRLARRGVRPAP